MTTTILGHILRESAEEETDERRLSSRTPRRGRYREPVGRLPRLQRSILCEDHSQGEVRGGSRTRCGVRARQPEHAHRRPTAGRRDVSRRLRRFSGGPRSVDLCARAQPAGHRAGARVHACRRPVSLAGLSPHAARTHRRRLLRTQLERSSGVRTGILPVAPRRGRRVRAGGSRRHVHGAGARPPQRPVALRHR